MDTFDRVMGAIDRIVGVGLASALFTLAVAWMIQDNNTFWWPWMAFFGGIGMLRFFGVIPSEVEPKEKE